jgi:dipicolinate synthase subunit A
MVAMENTDRVIEGMRILICGYGRIGKLLSDKMRRLGASVFVAARRDEILCEIAMAGFETVDLRQINDLIRASQNCEVILNTIPSQIFTRQVIEKIDGDPLYIEIASAPGGIDLQSARGRKMRIIFAPSLPGKYAPASAGEYIFETVNDILRKRGMDI